MCKQLGFMNIMHDKRVFRGSNFSKNKFKIEELPAARETVTRRQVAITRKKAADQEKIKKSPEARQAERENILQALLREKAIYKEKRAMRLQNKKTQKSNSWAFVQTATNVDKLYDHSQSETFGTQTEEDMFAKSVHEIRTGIDASIQIDKMELFDFDMEATPIIENMIVDVLRQANNEMLYNDKLAVGDKQRRILFNECTTAEIEKLDQEREDAIKRKIISDHTQLFDESEKNEKSRLSKLPSSYRNDFLPRVLQDPKQTETQADDSPTCLEFVSWLTNELQEEKMKSIKIEDILNEKYKQSASHDQSFGSGNHNM